MNRLIRTFLIADSLTDGRSRDERYGDQSTK